MSDNNFELKDSGERRTFSTGAVRDRGETKPRPDLISPHAEEREGWILAHGAEKYDARNWEKGIPISECVASLSRHLKDYKKGLRDEDHMAQLRTNAGFILHYEEEIKAGRMDPAVDDMPKYAERPDWETEDGSRAILLSDAEFDALVQRAYEIPPLSSEEARFPDPVHGLVGPCGAELPTFYVAGPMRGYKDLNFPAFDEAVKRGRALGFNIISPADLDREHGIDPDKDPAVTEHENTLSTAELNVIIRRDTEVIMALQPDQGDGIAVLPGWEDSTGATAEVALARWLGLRVVYTTDFYTGVE